MIIIPDYSIEELKTLCSVMYGHSRTGFVKSSLLETLGMSFKNSVCIKYNLSESIEFNGSLEGVAEIDDI